MFDITPPSRSNAGMIASGAAHLVFLLALLYRAAPVFVTPSDVQLGIPHSYGSRSIVYLAPTGPEREQAPADQPKLTLHRSAKLAQARKPEPRREPPAMTASDAPDETARGGSPFGRVPGSPVSFDEVMPAFPVVYPDPPVSRGDLPVGVQGDVIVEVTIDSQGNVIETRLLQGIGYGIEQKVLDVLQRWRFHPAVRNGVTIASQHIVHFHYPG
ncbi:MAG TPA: TonB family protein [Candidatus Bathyarchaeia archaeon]|nr:TonB family protein [Candidatus Bathyarchaeia archaeon]